MLALPISLERVQAIARRDLEVVQRGGQMHVLEFADRAGSAVRRESLRCAGGEELFRPAIGEGPDHGEM
ncbi:MAG TPA: hypothetical protein VHB25_20615 [Gemmatimonadaceae bacterium]|nr:hypothetical protein [Gemmatimonadaceae bacterium]